MFWFSVGCSCIWKKCMWFEWCKFYRNRFEFNKEYIDMFIEKGMVFSGESDNGKRMEILEIPSHKFFFGVQFHPEFSSRPGFPEETFKAFLEAASNSK